jgi:F-box protein 11
MRYPPSDVAALADMLERKIKRLGPLARVPAGTHVVERGAEGRNVHSTISSALEIAKAGDVILVRPGVYTEPLIIDKPLEIIGVGVLDADADRAIVRTQDSTAVTYRSGAGHGRIATMSIEGGGPSMCALDIVEGRVSVRGCTVSGRAPLEACVRIRGNGDATLHANVIRDSDGVGVLVCEHGDARISANLITRHSHSCIEVRDRTHPRIRANRISSGTAGGVWVHGGSHGDVERNEIFDHAMAGMTVMDNADPHIRGNRIYNCRAAGIHISGGGRGTISDNDVYANTGTGIEVGNGGEPLIEYNRVYDGLGGGIALSEGARAHIRHNHVRANQRAGIAFLAESGPVTFQGNTVMDGLAEGVYDEIGVPEDANHVYRNAKADWVRPAEVS